MDRARGRRPQREAADIPARSSCFWETGELPRKKLLFVVNVDWFFVSHRLPIAEAALRNGYEVHVACAVTERRPEIERRGIVVHELSIRRGGSGVAGEVSAFLAMLALMRRLRPDIVHLVTIKPVLIGGIAARVAGIRAVVAAVSGMGFVFIANGAVARLRRAAVAFLYRLALGSKNVTVIVQNPEDGALVAQMTGLGQRRIQMVKGSGVDLSLYRQEPFPSGPSVIVFAARLLGDKGLREFVAAARLLKQAGIQAKFLVAGDLDPHNPTAIGADELDRWRREEIIEFVGYCEIPKLFAAAHIVVLPSYREGLPKVLMEAAACGRAVITTDVPGCRDAVEAGKTALLVPSRSVKPLADAMKLLIHDRQRCEAMGRAARQMADADFSIERTVAAHLSIYARALRVGGSQDEGQSL